ncbi:MAG: hypothetical protein ISS77_03485 [Phycisphaerae bacterium]|nr:hypothetical protein [Phycisphaerae bacterium]
MFVLVQASILSVALGSEEEGLENLPVRLLTVQSAKEAAQSLKSEKVDVFVSRWELDDAEPCRFFRQLKMLKPDLPVIVIVESGQVEQEILARSVGVTSVLYREDCQQHLRRTLINILGLKEPITAANRLSQQAVAAKGI